MSKSDWDKLEEAYGKHAVEAVAGLFTCSPWPGVIERFPGGEKALADQLCDMVREAVSNAINDIT